MFPSMKTLLTILLLSFSTVLTAQYSPFFNSSLPEDSITHYLKEYDMAHSKSDVRKMDEIRSKLQATKLSYTPNQLAIKHYLDANYNSRIDLYHKATEKFSSAIRLAKHYKLRSLELYAQNGMAAVEYSLNDIDGAIKSFKAVLQNCKESDDQLMGRIHGNLAAMYFEKAFEYSDKKPFDSIKLLSDFHYSKAISTLENINKQSELGRIYAIYARSLTRDENYTLAKDYLVKADMACINTSNQYQFFFNQIKWSDFYKEQQEYLKARPYLYKALNYFRKVDNKEMLHYAQLELAVNYAYTRNFDSAYYYSITLEKLRKKMSIEKMGRQSKLYQVELDVFNKERKIKKQQTQIEFEQYQKELAEAKSKRWLIGGISAIAIVLLIAFLLIQNVRQKAKTEKANLIIEERERAFQEVLEGQEKERRRIAQELHDGVGQQLSGIKMALQNFMDASKSQTKFMEENIPPILSLVSSSAADVRLLAHQMQPQVLVEKGLKAALADLVQITHQTTKIKFGLEYKIDIAKLNEQYELAIYRCLQELINNTIKHAKASKIEIYIYENKTHLLIAYSDNGIGIQKNIKGKGLGLSGIKNRIESLNGSFSYDDSQNFGFSSIFKLPIL